MIRLFLVAGEASGDLHGGAIARALREAVPTCELAGMGGSEMERAGVRVLVRSEPMAVTGFWEVVRHLPRFGRILRDLERRLREDPPDALVLIDYPDFNLRLAERAHAAGVPVIYYISPQVWAWRRGRIQILKRVVRRMLVIFPFEEELYREAGVPVTYVGHPLVDRVRARIPRDEMRGKLGVRPGEHLVALLPGSRKSEVERILPVLLGARRLLSARKSLRWAIAAAPGLDPRDLSRAASLDDDVIIRAGETYEILAAADLALTASGTATVEAALLGTPMLVIYRMHPISWMLAKRLVRVPHVAMANLIAGSRIVPEFLQARANPRLLADQVLRWIEDADLRERTSRSLREAAARLGPGGAADRAARAILDEVRGR